ncbi:hypothetical protein FNAPI_2568 [Fusarium napiforme]|uniref:Uncharacterized protein n=1 Tax=Fusarium napiforme TaxID=42672 RepID=A0A8H5JYI3_9HYPO|nr:hypothetical protein FNAPI_2568 [Fusarium napiforme]
MLPPRNLRSRTVPSPPTAPRHPPSRPSRSLSHLSSPDLHENGEFTLVRLRLHPHPQLAPHQQSARVSLCLHNEYWASQGLRDETFHFHRRDHISHHGRPPFTPATAPTAPNYIVECNDINLWVSEDEGEDEHHAPAPPPPNHFTRFILYGLAVYTITVALFLVFRPLPYQPPAPLPEDATVQAPFVRSVLPVIDHYQHICLQYATLPRQYIIKETIPFTALDDCTTTLLAACSAMFKIGWFWDEQNGLTEEPWEYGRYRRKHQCKHKDSPVPDGAIDIQNLCHGARARVGDVATSFHDIVFMIAFRLPMAAQTVFLDLAMPIGTPYRHDSSPPCNSKRPHNGTMKKCEPMPVSWLNEFKTYIESFGLNVSAKNLLTDIARLQESLKLAFDDLSFVVKMAKTHVPPTPKRSWFKLGQDRPPSLLTTTIEPIRQMQESLTKIASSMESFLNLQTAILSQEDEMLSWLISLLAHAPDLESPYEMPGSSSNGTTSPWEIWRPKDELKTYGQWCVYPGCPKGRQSGDNVLVKLHLPNVEAAFTTMFGSLKLMNGFTKDMSQYMARWTDEMWEEAG